MTPRSAQSPDLGERVEQQEHVGQSRPRPKGSGKIHPSPNSILGAPGSSGWENRASTLAGGEGRPGLTHGSLFTCSEGLVNEVVLHGPRTGQEVTD